MKRVLILCNGRPPAKKLLEKYCAKADLFVAADGGGKVALEYGMQPDVVIGDLDSFEQSGDEPFEVIHKADQETNDLEKALVYARANDGSHVHIFGATGDRVDQTLKNLSVLKQFDPNFEELLLIDDFGECRLIEKSYERSLPEGTLVSLFPLSGKVSGITTRGLKYPLKDEALENGVRDGSSNRVVESPIRISYRSGDLLLFVAR